MKTKNFFLSIIISLILCFFCSCSNTQKDWNEAQRANTAESYNQFLKKHPIGEYADKARQNLKIIEISGKIPAFVCIEGVEVISSGTEAGPFKLIYTQGKWEVDRKYAEGKKEQDFMREHNVTCDKIVCFLKPGMEVKFDDKFLEDKKNGKVNFITLPGASISTSESFSGSGTFPKKLKVEKGKCAIILPIEGK